MKLWTQPFLLALLSLVAVGQTPITPINHVVFIVKENRSFDHLFGTLPNVNGATSGMISTGATIPLNPATDRVLNYDHSWQGVRYAMDNGKMDRFDLTYHCGASYGYACYTQYTCATLPTYCSYVHSYLLADNFFSSMTGPTFPNHLFTIAAQAGQAIGIPSGNKWGCDAIAGTKVTSLDPLTNHIYSQYPCFDYATLGDLLDSAAIPWKYYAPPPGTGGYQFSAYDAINHIRNGPDWAANVVSYKSFVTDAAAGNLPAVSWLVPPYSYSEHPPGLMSVGQNWTAKQINAVMSGPQWASTAIFLTWDDSGGFYDHAPPPQLDTYGAGIRVPLLILSPYVTPGTTYHKFATFESVLAFIEANWGLPSLTQRDARANNLMDAFTFPPSSGSPISSDTLPPRAPAILLPFLPEPKLSRKQIHEIEETIRQDKANHHDDD
jgi:phospholipase C